MNACSVCTARAWSAPTPAAKHPALLRARGRASPVSQPLARSRTDGVKCSAAAGHTSASPSGEQYVLSSGVADYYAILQVDDDATEDDIKAAYRRLAKICHPDFAGEAGHNLCILLNEAYSVLSNPIARTAYNRQLEVALEDEEDGYTGAMLSKWAPTQAPGLAKHTDPGERRAVFVDEQSCIGCKNCTWCAQATFRIESEYGRSRVFGQWLNDEEELQTAIESCPVDCIHWVDKDELPALEYVAQFKQQRVDVSMMMAQRSGGAGDVFSEREKFLRERQKLEERRKKAMDAMSPMQEEARRRAAETMASSHGWFAQWASSMAEQFSMGGASTGPAASDTPKARVGQRRRATWASEQEPSGPAVATVPVDRALVPVVVESRQR